METKLLSHCWLKNVTCQFNIFCYKTKWLFTKINKYINGYGANTFSNMNWILTILFVYFFSASTTECDHIFQSKYPNCVVVSICDEFLGNVFFYYIYSTQHNMYNEQNILFHVKYLIFQIFYNILIWLK